MCLVTKPQAHYMTIVAVAIVAVAMVAIETLQWVTYCSKHWSQKVSTVATRVD